MNKEELLKEIMELPEVETINPISTMSGINVDDLMSAIDRLNKIPDYNDLLKENQELKKQLEDMTLCRDIASGHREEVQDREAILLNQQKEFIDYLENKIDICDSFLDTIKSDLQETPYGVISTNKDITTRIKENETAHKVYEEILQKYKSIIGDINDKK